MGIMDADGQHLPEDMLKLLEAAQDESHKQVVGVRSVGHKMPLRSRIGNELTRSVFHLISGVRVSDTQTGLRAFGTEMIPEFLVIEGERYEDAVFMVTQLASLFRISLSRGKTIISMEDELKHARNYMNIQKIRYKNKFTVEFQVEDAILSCCTVKLVIQPLLENAIYYGMESMDGDGEITVVGYRKGDDVYVEVRDNGLGMPDEMVDALLTENNRVRKHGSGVGLINVHNRIRLRFGEPYGLEIESCLDEGTTVRIHLPYIAYSPENTELLEGGRLKQLKGERQDEEK